MREAEEHLNFSQILRDHDIEIFVTDDMFHIGSLHSFFYLLEVADHFSAQTRRVKVRHEESSAIIGRWVAEGHSI